MPFTNLGRSLALALVILLNCQCARGDGASAPTAKGFPEKGTQDNIESRIYDGMVVFPVQGWEFRSSYAGDKTGPGVVENARADLRAKCMDMETQLQTSLQGALVNFECLGERNVSKLADRATFEANASLQLTYTNIVKMAMASPLVGEYKKSNDFNPKSAAREAARQSFEAVCEQFTLDAKETYGRYLLLADCGVAVEKAQKDGWGYSSMPAVYYYDGGPRPADCGSHSHASRWYELDGNDPVRVNARCDFGGSRQDLFENYKEYRCENGASLETGRNRRGNLVQSIGFCEMPRNCGSHSHDSRWWIVDGADTITEAETCPYGGNRYRVYEREVLAKCWDGSVLTEDQYRQGRFIGYQGQCYQPRSCGSHPHEDRWWEVSGTIRDQVGCPPGYSGYVVEIYDREVVYSCYDGYVRRERERRGRLIARDNNCRPIGGGGGNGGGHGGGDHGGPKPPPGGGGGNGGGHGGGDHGGPKPPPGGGGNGGGHGGGDHGGPKPPPGGGNHGGHGRDGGNAGGRGTTPLPPPGNGGRGGRG